jgi:hypothetical protein
MRRYLVLLLLLAPGLVGCAATHRPDEITIRWTAEEEARQRPARPDGSISTDRPRGDVK